MTQAPVVPSAPALLGLLPALLRRRLAAAGSSCHSYSVDRFPAAVLIADVSGFTTIAERLAASGPEGVEELSRLVSQWFGVMVGIIEDHGGDVIRFAGDAPIAVFTPHEPGHQLNDAVASAAACAVALRDAMRHLRTADAADANVALRTGIGAGEVTAVVAGGVDGRWEWVVGGSPLQQMADAERIAAPGEIVLSPQACEAMGSVDGDLMPDGARRLRRVPGLVGARPLNVPVIDHEVARPFVPRAALRFMDAGQSAWTAELRRVTVLFLGVRGGERGIDLDTPDGADRLHQVLQHLQKAVFDCGGSINQFLVDDKGLTLLAAWGGSGHAHEDDALRAVRAAQAARAALATAGVSSRTGLATGRVFCGWRGQERRREYSLIGAVVNRAARLMTATTDGLLCDAATARAGSEFGRFDDAGHLVLKGSPEPVSIYRPIGEEEHARAGLSSDAGRPENAKTMIGRQAERQHLSAAVTAIGSGISSTIVISGEAGMGKSTLVADFISRARSSGVVTASGSVESLSHTRQYSAWRRVLASVMKLDTTAPVPVAIAALQDRLRGRQGLEAFAPLIAEVLGLPMPDDEVTSRITGQVRVEKTRDLAVQILQEAATAAPLAIVLDNVHWLDSLSLGLALAVQRRVAPLLLVLVTRPYGPDAPSDLTALVSAASTTVIDLARLTHDDVRRLICQRLGVTQVPDELATVVETKAAGYPLFVGELVSSLLDAGVIITSGSACVLADSGARLRAHQFPDSVQGAIAARLDRIGAAEQLTMKVASAVGAPFDADTIAAVHPLRPDEAQLHAMLATLTDRGFITRDAETAPYEFGHAVMQDVAYRMMPSDQRRALHRAVGEWYERAHQREMPAAMLAHHWFSADVEDKSLYWLERAGTDAFRTGAVREMLRHFGNALEVADRPSAAALAPVRRARWLRFMGQGHAELSAIDESARHLRTALNLLGGRVPPSRGAMVFRFGREVVRQMLSLSGILAVTPRPSAETRDRMLEEAEILRLLGKGAFFAQDHLMYLTASLQSINLAERIGARETAANAYASLAYPVAMLGLERLANRWWRVAEESGQLEAQLNTKIGRMMYLSSLARWSESARCAEEEKALIERLGTSTTIPAHLIMSGYLHLHVGRYDAAVRAASALLDWSLSAHNLQQALSAHLILVAVYLEQGRLDLVRNHLADVAALASRVTDTLYLSVFHGHRVDVHLATGDLEGARESAATLRQVIASSSAYFGDMAGFVAMTEYFVELWRRAAPGEDVSTMKRDARWALGVLAKHAKLNPYARPRLWLMTGKVAACDRRFARARRAWQRALTLAEQYGMAREAAYAHAELGRSSTVPAADRRAHLTEARSRFERLGSPHRVLELTQAIERQAAEL